MSEEKTKVKAVKHKHADGCPYEDFSSWLACKAPDILWYNVQDVGSYQGSVYAVGQYKDKIVVYEGYYGSCGGCGAWGEGGEPADQKEILESCTQHKSAKEAMNYIDTGMSTSEGPDLDTLKLAALAAGRKANEIHRQICDRPDCKRCPQ